MERIAPVLGAAKAAQGLNNLVGRLGVRRMLREIGMPFDGIDQAVATNVDNPY